MVRLAQFSLLAALFLALLGSNCPKKSIDDYDSGDDDSGGDDDATGDDDTTTDSLDADNDGWPRPQDCDDGDPAIHPEAPEICNGKDDDCDGAVDENLPSVKYFRDVDEDGYGDPAGSVMECDEPGPGYTLDNTDCDDSSATIHPGAIDTAGDGIDSDCDGLDCQTNALGGARFGLCFGEFTWFDARGVCVNGFGGDMASIESAAEQQFVRELMIAANMPYTFIGLTDDAVEGTFLWVNAASLTYTNWGTGEPNNGGGGGGGERDVENCAAIQGDQDYIWNDVPCDFVSNSAVLCGAR